MTALSDRTRRWPWAAAALSFAVLLTSLATVEPVRNAVTGAAVGDARLDRSIGYVALGPISSVLDAITLFGVEQHIALGAWLIVLFLITRVARGRSRGTTVTREIVAVAAFLGGLLALYAAVAALPRPMARLVITRTDVVAIDFHTHTRYSHDGRVGWTAQRVLDWHEAAGYDVAYLTDHKTFDGVAEGLPLDPPVAGRGTTLLPGLEAYFKGEHVNILNAGVRYKGLTTADYATVDENALVLTSFIKDAEPILIETLPGNLSAMTPAHGERTAGVRAIELVDGSPRGLSQTRRERNRIVHLADSLNLAVVAGTDNHGWGRTAPAWTLMRIEEWRGYAPDSLAQRIERGIRVAGRTSTAVVERTYTPTGSGALVVTPLAALWTILTTITPEERGAWIVWIWGVWVVAWMIRRRRAHTT